MTARYVCLIAIAIALGACQEASIESTPDVVASVVTEPAMTTVIRDTIDAYGTVELTSQQVRIVDSAAEVIVDQILVSPGQSVAIGDPLLRVRASANSALELRKAQSDLTFAEASQARILRLRTEQLATNADVDAARQATANARAALANIRARGVGEVPTLLRAPADGIVTSVDVARAAMVPAGTALLHLADSGRVQARLGIEPADLRRLRKGQSVTLEATYEQTVVAAGVVAQIVAQIDPQSRLAAAIIEVPADAGLMPGATVRATIELARREHAIAVARAAVLYADQRPYVYVLDAGVARRVWVSLGREDSTRSEIVAGLTAGDPVVVVGNYELEDGMRADAEASADDAPAGPESQ